jgi:hypothetical protein
MMLRLSYKNWKWWQLLLIFCGFVMSLGACRCRLESYRISFTPEQIKTGRCFQILILNPGR